MSVSANKPILNEDLTSIISSYLQPGEEFNTLTKVCKFYHNWASSYRPQITPDERSFRQLIQLRPSLRSADWFHYILAYGRALNQEPLVQEKSRKAILQRAHPAWVPNEDEKQLYRAYWKELSCVARGDVLASMPRYIDGKHIGAHHFHRVPHFPLLSLLLLEQSKIQFTSTGQQYHLILNLMQASAFEEARQLMNPIMEQQLYDQCVQCRHFSRYPIRQREREHSYFIEGMAQALVDNRTDFIPDKVLAELPDELKRQAALQALEQKNLDRTLTLLRTVPDFDRHHAIFSAIEPQDRELSDLFFDRLIQTLGPQLSYRLAYFNALHRDDEDSDYINNAVELGFSQFVKDHFRSSGIWSAKGVCRLIDKALCNGDADLAKFLFNQAPCNLTAKDLVELTHRLIVGYYKDRHLQVQLGIQWIEIMGEIDRESQNQLIDAAVSWRCPDLVEALLCKYPLDTEPARSALMHDALDRRELRLYFILMGPQAESLSGPILNLSSVKLADILLSAIEKDLHAFALLILKAIERDQVPSYYFQRVRDAAQKKGYTDIVKQCPSKRYFCTIA